MGQEHRSRVVDFSKIVAFCATFPLIFYINGAVVWQSRVWRKGLQTDRMVSVVRNYLNRRAVAVVHDAEDRIGAVAVGDSADFVVVPLGPQILRSAVHCGAHDGFSLSWQGEVAVSSRDLQLVAEILPVAHSVEPWQDEIQDWQEPLVRRTVARQLIREGLYGHGWHSGSVQEKGLGVKD